MNWLEITIKTESFCIEEVAGALTAGGFDDLVMEDQAEFSAFLEQNRAYWDYIDEALQEKLRGRSCIKLYLADTDDAGMEKLKKLLQSLRQRGAYGQLEMTVCPLAQENWEESWKDNYPPQPVGQSLVVLPYWLADTDTDGRKAVILDPGLTFGTGAHASTQMVMEEMETQVKSGMKCLDLGSGSGILSITALRLGAEQAIGVDIDPKAEDVARENGAYNGFGAPAFVAMTGNVLTDSALMRRLSECKYDLVLVNIVADVIIGLSGALKSLVAENGTVICSGILDSRLSEVVAALGQAGFTVVKINAKENWRCVRAVRSSV